MASVVLDSSVVLAALRTDDTSHRQVKVLLQESKFNFSIDSLCVATVLEFYSGSDQFERVSHLLRSRFTEIYTFDFSDVELACRLQGYRAFTFAQAITCIYADRFGAPLWTLDRNQAEAADRGHWLPFEMGQMRTRIEGLVGLAGQDFDGFNWEAELKAAWGGSMPDSGDTPGEKP